MDAPDTTPAARALALVYEKHNPEEIATILSAEFGSSGQRFTADEARDLYQEEFRRQRSAWA